jgi:hypothetical protein
MFLVYCEEIFIQYLTVVRAQSCSPMTICISYDVSTTTTESDWKSVKSVREFKNWISLKSWLCLTADYVEQSPSLWSSSSILLANPRQPLIVTSTITVLFTVFFQVSKWHFHFSLVVGIVCRALTFTRGWRSSNYQVFSIFDYSWALLSLTQSISVGFLFLQNLFSSNYQITSAQELSHSLYQNIHVTSCSSENLISGIVLDTTFLLYSYFQK